MATIALTAAASGMGPGAYVAAAMVGSMIDNMFIMPTLFPPDPIEGQKVGEIGVSGADEGDPVSMVFGQYAVCPAQYVWASDYLNERSQQTKVGKSGTRVDYEYYTHAVVAFCYLGERWSPGTIATVDQIFMNEKRVYANSATTPPTTVTELGMAAWKNGNRYFVLFDDDVNASIKADIYDKFDVGDTVTFSGYTNAANNDSSDRIIDKIENFWWEPTTCEYDSGRGKWESSGKFVHAWRMQKEKTYNADTISCAGDATVTLYEGFRTNAVTVTGVAYSGWADDLFIGSDPTPRLGSQTSAWATYESEVGSDVAPAWIDMAWTPLPSILLNDFGGRLPSVRAVISADTSLRDPRGIIGHILLQGGLDASEYDVSGVDNSATVLGYTVKGPQEINKALQPIMLAHDIVAQERGGTIYFLDRADQVSNTTELESDFIGATEGNEIGGGKVQIQEHPTDQLPAEIEVTFTDFADGNLGKGMARAHMFSEDAANLRDSNHRYNKLSFNFDMTMTDDDAREIAWRLLTRAHSDNLSFRFTLPPRYIWLQENDRVQFTTGGVTYKALLTKVDLGANFVVEVEATLDVAVEQDFSDWTA
jgi:hypothetical protein